MGLGKTLQAIACLVHAHGVHCDTKADRLRKHGLVARAEAARAAIAADLGVAGWQLTPTDAQTHMGNTPLPSLVVVPNSIAAQWCAALDKWGAGGLHVVSLTSSHSAEHVAETLQIMIDRVVDVVVTTHSCVSALAVKEGQHRRGGLVTTSLASVPLGLLVVDEAHNCTTAEGVGRAALQALHAQTRLLLTGTAISHGAGDLLGLLDFGGCLTPPAWEHLFKRLAAIGLRSRPALSSGAEWELLPHVSLSDYCRRLQSALTHTLRRWRSPESTPLDKAQARGVVAELERCAAPYVLRRSKASVLAHCLPAKHSVVLFCTMSPPQWRLYRAAASDAIADGAIVQGLWQRVFHMYKRMAPLHSPAEYLRALGRAVAKPPAGDSYMADGVEDASPLHTPAPAAAGASSAVDPWQQLEVQAAAAAESVHVPAFAAYLGDRCDFYALRARVTKGAALIRQVLLRKLAQSPEFMHPPAGCPPLQARLERELGGAVTAQAASAAAPPPSSVAAGGGASGFQTGRVMEPQESSKMVVLLQVMAGLFRRGSAAATSPPISTEPHRVLIFSHSTRVLDYIRLHLGRAGYNTVAIHGRDGRGSARDAVVASINSSSSGVHAACISTTAGGEGLNLTGANVVVHWDMGFSPAKQRQAEDRAYRLGQRRDVLVLSLATQGGIEETMLYRQITKDWEARLLLDAQRNDAFVRQDDVFGPQSLWRCEQGGFFEGFRDHWLQLRKRGVLAPDASVPNLCMGPVQTSTYAGLLEGLLRHARVSAWLDMHVVEDRRGGGEFTVERGVNRIGQSGSVLPGVLPTSDPPRATKRGRGLFNASAPRLLSAPPPKAPRLAPKQQPVQHLVAPVDAPAKPASSWAAAVAAISPAKGSNLQPEDSGIGDLEGGSTAPVPPSTHSSLFRNMYAQVSLDLE